MFENGHFHGQGILKTHNGDKFTGNFMRSKLNGKCVIEYQNGDFYDGNLFQGEYSGNIQYFTIMMSL